MKTAVKRVFRAIRASGGAFARRCARLSRRTRRVSVAVALVLTVAAAAGVVLLTFEAANTRATTQAREDAVAAAKKRVADVLSYSAASIDADIDKARQSVTGAFAQYYVPFAQKAILPAVREQGTTSRATISRIGVSKASADSVDMVVFIDQSTGKPGQPEPQSSTSTAQVTMRNVAGQWLIAELRPTSA